MTRFGAPRYVNLETRYVSTWPQLAEKQKKAEYNKQYRLKCKTLIQQQASTSSETELVQKQQKAEYAKE
jgi:hypothetical protein